MWRNATVKNKTFWHITKKEFFRSIQENGIFKSTDGQVGTGVYAIIPDLDVLDNLLEFFELERKNLSTDVIAVEFSYSGEIVESPVKNFIYENEGWIKIENKIPAKNIISIVNYDNFNLLEKVN